MSGLKGLSSGQLLAQLLELVHRSRNLEADLIALLSEVDERRLYLREGWSSMFAYCVGVLHFAEAVAYKRIAAMRAARQHPELLTALRAGDLHLTAVSLLAPQLTSENVTELLVAARHQTANEIRRMLADRHPKPDVVSSVRRLSDSPAHPVSSADRVSSTRHTPSVGCVSSTCCAPSVGYVSSTRDASSPRPPEPLGDERYLIRFTADRELHTQIQELKSLMRHQIPDGDVGKILAKSVAVLLKQVRARKFGACSAPHAARSERIVRTESAKRVERAKRAKSDKRIEPGERAKSAKRIDRAATPSPSRQIPAAIRRAVSKRDGECCTFVSATGRRCGSRDFLEFHHREPWARHRSHAIDGITLRCRAHNQYEAERDFGAKHMERFRRRNKSETPTLLPQAAALLPETAGLLSHANPSPAHQR